jgi:hypothetical protein
MAMLQNSGNPMMMLTQLAQQNPMMSRAMQMGQGKNEMQLKETVRNAQTKEILGAGKRRSSKDRRDGRNSL